MCPVTIGELKQIPPGSILIAGPDGRRVAGNRLDELVEELHDEPYPNPADEAARRLIAQVCSPYRTRLDDGSWDEDEVFLEVGGRTFHNALSVRGHFPKVGFLSHPHHLSVAACPPRWGGLIGTLITDGIGAVEAPALGATEPVLDDAVREQVISGLLGTQDGRMPDDLVWNPPVASPIRVEPLPAANVRSMAGLVTVSTVARRGIGIAVVGDKPEDFALARLWRLTYGSGVWLPSSLGVDDEVPPSSLRVGLSEIEQRYRQRSGSLLLVSTSRPVEELEALQARLFRSPIRFRGEPAQPTVSACTVTELPWGQPTRTHLAVAEQFDTHVTVPVVVDDSGTRTMAAPLPAPILGNDHVLPPNDLTWQVDIGWPDATTVRGRGLDGQEVFTGDTNRWLTWARSSRHGITYQSHRFDFVAAGTPIVNKLARPAVRDLGLRRWVEAKAREHGLQIHVSDAGHRGALLARMLGGRHRFVDLFSGPLLDALRALRPTSSSTNKAYPAGDGVALAHDQGVLTFEGFCARSSALDRREVRDLLDMALGAGVLRRGLALVCANCEEAQFQSIDRLGQAWTCLRCDTPGQLQLSAWKKPDHEPTWFYDLHPVARHLLRDNGEVPALLSAYLATQDGQGQRRVYQDIEEVEFTLDGKPQVEIDLIVYDEDVLTVAECKSTANLAGDKAGSRAEVTKKCRAAAWLQADRLIFATTAPRWNNSTYGVIRSAVAEFDWGPLGPPEVGIISGLGTMAIEKQSLAAPSIKPTPDPGGTM
ncbi:hypothetical protein DFJ66_7812 [Saccharothrix variisporea]|uniref:Uncharacterized protein n=2 Tax=Saccharothrix variisporea TaxID=543527 RepID=A0A495XPS6_9PSEU|nr:hypothetical protein DFJ66_7812 [Saccharothrix variisporea]